MNEGFRRSDTAPVFEQSSSGSAVRVWRGPLVLVGLVAVCALGYHLYASRTTSITAAQPPSVAVSQPLQRDLETRLGFLGQFSAVERVELRAQVGGTLREIHFKDGEIVHQGQLLFEIDPEPYQIKLAQATAALEAANARFNLATQELARAQQLKSTDAGTTENVEQKNADKLAAQAAVDGARALVRDAKFDLDRTRVVAPFMGRIGTHLVSVGNLISGSRAGSGPTTLLTTLVSLNPIWLNFDMSESDYLTFLRQREKVGGPLKNQVQVALADETAFDRIGTLDFVDNALDRGSGTIHARATLQNADALLTPGAFGRVHLAVSGPLSTMLVPDAAVLSDQSDHAVLIVGKDNVVAQKKVEVGGLRGGLRVIRAGLAPTDRVIIEGIPSARPGSPVSPQAGTIQFASDQD
jgi:RND family efflux transporter MFP subunit